jgi:hypothetical protein
MSAQLDKPELLTVLKIGLACGISVALVELYYLVLALADSGISQPIYQTLWLLTAFLFALAGVWTVRLLSKNIKNIYGAVLYSGLSGLVVGALYIAAVIVVELIRITVDIRYFDLASFLTNVFSVVFSSLLWLPAIVAVSILGGIAYAVFMIKN